MTLTDGIESAVRWAKVVAGDKDVTVVGGPNLIQQLVEAGLMDGLAIGIMSGSLEDG